jgi:hypothetical protein
LDELGVKEEAAELAVAHSDGDTTGCDCAASLPLPENDARRQAALLVEYLGFTPDEAARYLAGDQAAIKAVAVRRMTADVSADAGGSAEAPETTD